MDEFKSRFPWFSWLALVVVLAGLVAQIAITPPSEQTSTDFVAYWSAAALLLDGQDPFDGDALLATQNAVGWPGDYPNRVWYPPWALALMAPFGALPFAPAHRFWVLLNLALGLLAVHLWWRRSGGSETHWWVAWVVAMCFYPFLAVPIWGQASFLVLIGLVGFVHLVERGRDVAAGGVLALATVKPHIAFLVWPALLLWTARTRRLGALMGLAGACGLALGALLAVDAGLVEAWLATVRDRPPGYDDAPAMGMLLRQLVAPTQLWLQFAMVPVGLAWWAWRARTPLQWHRDLPALIVVSVLTTPFLWSPDLCLMTLCVLEVALALKEDERRLWAVGLGVIGIATLAAHEVLVDRWFAWIAPTVAAIWVWKARR